jgi:hypothetical protein
MGSNPSRALQQHVSNQQRERDQKKQREREREREREEKGRREECKGSLGNLWLTWTLGSIYYGSFLFFSFFSLDIFDLHLSLSSIIFFKAFPLEITLTFIHLIPSSRRHERKSPFRKAKDESGIERGRKRSERGEK